MPASIAPPTIAAIATPPGRGGVGIVRVSGDNLDALIAGIIGAAPAPRVATVATFLDALGAPLDQGIALFFPAGLVLYWLVNNSLQIFQQWHMNRVIGNEAAVAAAKRR